MFIAPSVIFFALTGALQLYGLHEARGGPYQPSPVIEKLGMLHKDQVFQLKPKRARPAAAPTAPDAAKAVAPAKSEEGPKVGTVLLKALFLVVALALTAATALGVWMAVSYGRDRKVAWGLLIAGTGLPILLTVFAQGG
ncbi:hypothetical protein ACRAWD_28355 [Caulobacter segnis]